MTFYQETKKFLKYFFHDKEGITMTVYVIGMIFGVLFGKLASTFICIFWILSTIVYAFYLHYTKVYLKKSEDEKWPL